MKNVDYAHKMTDRELIILEKRIEQVYKQASVDIQSQMDAFFRRFEKKNAEWLLKIKNGQASIEDYQKWMKGQVFMGKRWKRKADNIATSLYEYNNIAMDMVNGVLDRVCINNANYMAYLMEHGESIDFNFELFDAQTIKAILKDDADILPYKKINKGKDVAWNFTSIKNEVAKGIIKGDSINKIAESLATSIPNRNMGLLKTHARTMVNSAHNQGRQLRFEDAKAKGIKLKKRWIATLDARTRYSHAVLDGQTVDIEDSFDVEGYEIRFPSDPHAHPALTYNCRCDMGVDIVGYPPEYRRDNEDGDIIEFMSYKEWFEWKGGDFSELDPRNKARKGGK